MQAQLLELSGEQSAALAESSTRGCRHRSRLQGGMRTCCTARHHATASSGVWKATCTSKSLLRACSLLISKAGSSCTHQEGIALCADLIAVMLRHPAAHDAVMQRNGGHHAVVVILLQATAGSSTLLCQPGLSSKHALLLPYPELRGAFHLHVTGGSAACGSARGQQQACMAVCSHPCRRASAPGLHLHPRAMASDHLLADHGSRTSSISAVKGSRCAAAAAVSFAEQSTKHRADAHQEQRRCAPSTEQLRTWRVQLGGGHDVQCASPMAEHEPEVVGHNQDQHSPDGGARAPDAPVDGRHTHACRLVVAQPGQAPAPLALAVLQACRWSAKGCTQSLSRGAQSAAG